MKKLIFLSVLIFLTGMVSEQALQGQTTQTQLDQLKLMQQLTGTWQADHGKDTLEVWDYKPYGKAMIITVSWIIKGQKTPYYINNISYSSIEGKFYGFALFASGGNVTWTGSYVSEKKFSVEMSTNYNPEKVLGKFEQILESTSTFTWQQFNTNGAMVQKPVTLTISRRYRLNI